ncbi:hypothetical protein C0J52_16393 [Blattella germanica]|nr:hypothetical protein C0J52_16393 [Blattella germanica]
MAVPILLLLMLSAVSGVPETINIGGLFLNTEELEEQVFQLTAEDISSDHSILKGKLVALPETVEPHNSLKVSHSVCKLLELGVAGIFGPRAGVTSSTVQSICDTMDIPHIETSWDTNQRRQDFLINLHPHPSTLAKLYAEMVTAWGWDSFTVLYEEPSGLTKLNSLLKLFDNKGKAVTVRQLDPLHNHRPVLREIKSSGERNIVLDCSTESLPEVLKQAQQVGLVTSDQNYIITSMDLHTIDVEPFQHGGTNITGLRMVDPENEAVQMAVRRWADLELKRGKKLNITPETLTVCTYLSNNISNPYGMRRQSSEQLKGNDRFEGFGIELIHELSLILGFNYTFELQLDNAYGSLNKETGQWNGMIRQLLDYKADLAITDLTITSEREAAVDFTMPFMSLGISILYKRPTKEAPKLFSFMSPFSIDVWVCMFSVYIGVSILLWMMGRAVSTRMVAGIWWFFTLIIVSSYTANLAAFLTVESMTSPFKNVKELANQNVIKYGAKRGGSTVNFFRDSTDEMYRKMYQYMMDNQADVLTSSNEEGLEWVKTKNYAFFMESTSIQYITERDCDVAQVGDELDSKGYGIAMRKNSTYRNQLSTAVLKLQESGKLSKMKIRWWKEERGGGKCSDSGGSGNPSPLNLQNVGGVFVVLVAGTFGACFVALFELICHVRETAKQEKVSFREVLAAEWKFIARCHGSSKTISKYSNSQDKDSPQPEDSQDFVRMSIYGPSPYGFKNNITQPIKQ